MAIETRIVNDSFTEIYVGGGNYLTQSAPTNFHQFYKRKILTDGESADDFREVTAAEKAALEASDAKWEAPSEEFIAKCKLADPNLVWNATTGYFEHNGLKDITVEQMEAIYEYGRDFCPHMPLQHILGLLRTNLLPYAANLQFNYLPPRAFFEASSLETVRVSPDNVNLYTARCVSGADRAFYSCSNLREIRGAFTLSNLSALPSYMFYGCSKLETLKLISLNFNINLSTLKSLSAESVLYMIEHRDYRKAITITLHPEAYARVTDEIFAAAAEKQITIAST